MLTDETRKALSAALREGKFSEAKALLKEEEKQNPDSEALMYFRGVLAILEGRTEEGSSLLKQAMYRAEESSNLLITMAAGARLGLLYPDNVELRLHRADIYLMSGMVRAAYEYLLREFEFYRRRNNSHAITLIVKKMLAIDEGNLDLALGMAKILEKLEKRDEVKRVVENAVFVLQGQGKYSQAAEIQKKYSKLFEEP